MDICWLIFGSMDKIIEAKNLTKKYGDFTAVRDISFWVNEK